ncbi:glycosyltransferase (plasmid) [Cetobacterium somerae]|uniref:glycosyltransferase n=1 Tax=Cetobacterium somerae TaxID=188913 RepID=UPI003D76983D
MKKILFISKNYKDGIINGGNEVTRRNFEILSNFFDIEEVLLDYKVSILKKFKDTLFLNSLSFDKEIKFKIFRLIKENNIKEVWIDNSLYGTIAKFIKKLDSTIKIITFFHNIEYLYFKDKIKVEGIQNSIMLPYSYINEKRSLKYSDKIIVLNSRDNDTLKKIYSKKADLILPLTLKDKYNEEKIKIVGNNKKPRALFVGSNFFANVEGIKWFIDNVLPEVDIELIIVGSGMNTLKEELENKSSKIKVLGFVDDIGLEYAKADFVIAPIFKGSGMKTKTTEALMYGKTIFGTTEAFEGFELEYFRVGALCNNQNEFINVIKENKFNRNNEYSRYIYLSKYSNESVTLKLALSLKRSE